jgi:hypothetical protein
MTTTGYQQHNQAPQQGGANIQQLLQSILQAQAQQSGFGMGAFNQGQGNQGQGYQGYGSHWWGGNQQSQLSPQDIHGIVQQLAPALSQLIAQSQQQQSLGAFAGGGYGGNQRLSPQDINEVVRQILPILPQLFQAAQNSGQNSQQQGSWQQGSQQQGFGQGAFDVQNCQQGQHGQQRQFSQQDISEIVRQLVEAVPQSVSQQSGQQNSQQRN